MKPLLSVLLIVGTVPACADEDATRQIWDAEFRMKRPAPSSPKATPVKRLEYRFRNAPATPRQPHAAAAVVPPAKDAVPALVGVTVWRLRKPASSDRDAARLLVQDTAQAPPAEFVPARLHPDEPLREGDRVRLAIESPRTGYLYVVDRERYSDGTSGAPHLVFPAANLNNGDNRVSPGRLIEIPGQSDKTPALRLARNGERHIGEELLIVVTSSPLPDVPVAAGTTPIPAEVVSRWEREWSAPVSRLDLSGGAETWTPVEKSAGNSARLLTQDDPMPQSIYQTSAPAGAPLLVRMFLEVR